MKNVTLDRATALQLDANGTDSALDAAADCNALRNDVALDLCDVRLLFFRRYEGAMRESGDSSTQHQRYHAARSDEPTGTHRSNFLVDIGSTPNSSRR